jgi:pyruvate formate lyase activating enzyme
VDGCPNAAVSFDKAGVNINPKKCFNCFVCASGCPSGALAKVGNSWNVADLAHEACKDSMFFGEFDGGITVSGGEPLLQYQFTSELLKALKEKSENTALDTSGFAGHTALEAVYPYVDVFLYDLKFIDRNLHIEHTGADNRLILSNLIRLFQKSKEDDSKRIWIRTPLIPGATATVENIAAIGGFLRTCPYEKIERWELCAFNNVCRDKYARMRIDWAYSTTPLMTADEIEVLLKTARKYLPYKVFATGLFAKQNETSINN